MKKIYGFLLALTLFLAAAQVARADGPFYLMSVTSTSATGQMFSTTALPNAVTYSTSATPATAISGVILRRLWVQPVGAATNLTITVWDAPAGVTGSPKARLIGTYLIQGSVFTYKEAAVYDYTVPTGLGKDGSGLYFRYNPTVVDAQVNTAAVYGEFATDVPKNIPIPQ